MLIKFFKSSFIIQYIALVILAAVLWIPAFLNHTGIPPGNGLITPIYTLAEKALHLFGAAGPIAASLIVFISALTLNNILVFHELTPKNNLLPAFLFILFMSSNPAGLGIYPYLLALPLFTWFVHTIFKMNDEPENYMEVFNAGILVAVISMIYPAALVLFLFIWLAMLVYGIFNGRNLIISVIALGLPFLYLFMYFFWTDQVGAALKEYADYFVGIFSFEINRNLLQLCIWGIFAIMMMIPAFTKVSGSLGSTGINFRKKMAATNWLFILSIPLIILYGDMNHNSLIFLPASILIAHYFQMFKKSIVHEVSLLVFLILILVNSYLPYFHA